MATNAQHQASYRTRQVAAGSVRLDTHISADAHAALSTLAKREGASLRAVVETAILNEHKEASMPFRKDDPATDSVTTPCKSNQLFQPARKDHNMTNPAPPRPSQMTVAEFQELEKFKESLPNAMINAELDARHMQANGGFAAMSQKERVAASFLANNIHRT